MNIKYVYATGWPYVCPDKDVVHVDGFDVYLEDGFLRHPGLIAIFESTADMIAESANQTALCEIMPETTLVLIPPVFVTDIFDTRDVLPGYDIFLKEAEAGSLPDTLLLNEITGFTLMVLSI